MKKTLIILATVLTVACSRSEQETPLEVRGNITTTSTRAVSEGFSPLSPQPNGDVRTADPEPEPVPDPPTIYFVTCYTPSIKIWSGKVRVYLTLDSNNFISDATGKEVWISGGHHTCVWESQ